MLQPVPDFVRDRALLRGAYATALWAHHGPRRHGATKVEHPVAVAELLDQRGFSEEIVAAALLHDVVEDTDIDIGEIRARFGEEVAALVARMTEDETIKPYRERKAEHRDRVAGDRRVAAIYAADKLAHAQEFNADHEEPEAQRLEHYRRTLVELSEAYPSLSFLSELSFELDRLGWLGSSADEHPRVSRSHPRESGSPPELNATTLVPLSPFEQRLLPGTAGRRCARPDWD